MTTSNTRLIATAIALTCIAGCATSPSAEGIIQTRTYRVVNYPEPGDIPYQTLPAVIPEIAELRPQPSTITIGVGGWFKVGSIEVLAFDSSGKLLGRLKQVDRDVDPGGVVQMRGANVIEGTKAGTGYLVVSAPMWGRFGNGRPQPTARVAIQVVPS